MSWNLIVGDTTGTARSTFSTNAHSLRYRNCCVYILFAYCCSIRRLTVVNCLIKEIEIAVHCLVPLSTTFYSNTALCLKWSRTLTVNESLSIQFATLLRTDYLLIATQKLLMAVPIQVKAPPPKPAAVAPVIERFWAMYSRVYKCYFQFKFIRMKSLSTARLYNHKNSTAKVSQNNSRCR